MAGDLGELAVAPPCPPAHDHELVACDPAPHLLALVAVGRRVADRPPPDRLVVADGACLAECCGVRGGGQRMQVGPLVDERLARNPVGLPVDPPVHGLAESLARRLERSEAGVGTEQVGLGRHEVGLGNADRCLDATFGLRVVGDAAFYLEPVVTADGDHLGVADGDAGDVLDGDRLLVVGEQVGRCPAEAAQGGIEAGDERRKGAIPGRDHDAEPAPGKPGAEQAGLPAAHVRALGPVELAPHARLGDPGPVAAAVAPG